MSDVARAAAILRAGGLVAFPTETVYGLGAHALDAIAVRKIFAAKGRPPENPVIVHVADVDGARRLCRVFPAEAERLAARFWPGPLTLVLPRVDAVPDEVTAGGPTVGVRVPAHPLALALLRAADLPVAAPSANPSLSISPTTAAHVRAGLGDRVDFVLDGGPCPGGIESTVLALGDGLPRILRPGLVTAHELEAEIGPVLVGADPAATLAASPGLQRRHYAPRAPLARVDDLAPVRALLDRGAKVGLLAFEAGDPRAVVVRMPRDPRAYAAQLYAALHALDAEGVAAIFVARVPDEADWLAVRDRLARAAT